MIRFFETSEYVDTGDRHSGETLERIKDPVSFTICKECLEIQRMVRVRNERQQTDA